MTLGVVSSAGVGPLCILELPLTAAAAANKLFSNCVHTGKDHANSPDQNLTENLSAFGRHQSQQCRRPKSIFQSNLNFHNTKEEHRLRALMPQCVDAGIHAKGGPTMY